MRPFGIAPEGMYILYFTSGGLPSAAGRQLRYMNRDLAPLAVGLGKDKGKPGKHCAERAVDAKVRVDAQLTVGNVSESVEVTGTAQALQTDSSDLNTSFSQSAIQNLPNIYAHI